MVCEVYVVGGGFVTFGVCDGWYAQCVPMVVEMAFRVLEVEGMLGMYLRWNFVLCVVENMRCVFVLLESMVRVARWRLRMLGSRQEVEGMLCVIELVDVCDTLTQVGNGKCYKNSHNDIENDDSGC